MSLNDLGRQKIWVLDFAWKSKIVSKISRKLEKEDESADGSINAKIQGENVQPIIAQKLTFFEGKSVDIQYVI